MSQIKDSIGYLIDFSTRAMRRYATLTFRKSDIPLTMDQWAILNITKDNEGMVHLTLLCQAMVKDAPTMTKMVDALCKKGFLDRQLDPNDRRKWNLIITKEGKSAEKRAFKVVEEIRANISKGLDDKDIRDLQRVLNKIIENTGFSDI